MGKLTDRNWRVDIGVGTLTCIFAATPGLASSLVDRRLIDAISELEGRGVAVLYSSDLVRPWMRVRQEPLASDPTSVLAEIVAPFGLAVQKGPNGSLLLVRTAREPRATTIGSGVSPIGVAILEEVTVMTSRYRLSPATSPPIQIESADLELLPDIGDDPLRAVSRLPGTASGDFTAKANFRGGEVDETLVRFDGLRLFNPFHFKDFQSIFSTIDPGIIRGIEVYTGAFPATFGDRMSGVINIESLPGSNTPQRELMVSFFNTSGRVADSFDEGRGQWLLSARRSNLDLLFEVLDEDRGQPRYTDAYARLGYHFTDAVALTGSVLRFHDDLDLHDSDREEQAVADYRDEYYWLRLDYEPGPDLQGSVMAARSELTSERIGTLEQPGIATGELEDRRDFTVNSLQTDWLFSRSENLAFAFGAEWREFEGRYVYEDEVEFALLFLTPGAPDEPSRARSLSASPSGHQFGAYATVRMQAWAGLTADLGLRWDQESLSPSGGERIGPRMGLLQTLGDRTKLRAGWGRYFQSQAINELQISDGITQFLPPQRADHWDASIEYEFDNGIDLRLETYWKEYDDLRPRYENLLNTFVLLPELKPDRIQVAPATASARGVEFTLSGRSGRPLDWWFTYTWSSVRDEFPDSEIERSWDQTNSFGAGLAWRSERWDFSVAGSYRTGWPTTAFELATTEPIPLVTTGPRNAERLGNYRSIDARIARKFQLERAGDLTVFLEITNLFNERNACCVEYEFNDEEAPLGLEVETTNYIPAFPSLGVIWRF